MLTTVGLLHSYYFGLHPLSEVGLHLIAYSRRFTGQVTAELDQRNCRQPLVNILPALPTPPVADDLFEAVFRGK
jgi:hypothetical protein